jgi:hypothetical protein
LKELTVEKGAIDKIKGRQAIEIGKGKSSRQLPASRI